MRSTWCIMSPSSPSSKLSSFTPYQNRQILFINHLKSRHFLVIFQRFDHKKRHKLVLTKRVLNAVFAIHEGHNFYGQKHQKIVTMVDYTCLCQQYSFLGNDFAAFWNVVWASLVRSSDLIVKRNKSFLGAPSQ